MDIPLPLDRMDVVLVDRLRSAVAQINSNIPRDAQEEAIKKAVNVAYSNPNLLTANQAFHKMLTEGTDVEYAREDGTIAGDKVYLFDVKNLNNNDWLAVNQFTVVENNHNRRPDVMIFVNGLPIAIFELKNPADANATLKSAFNQIQTYKAEIPSLFAYNEICVLADHVKSAVVGTISADMDRFVGWKSVDGKKIVKTNDLEILIKGVFAKERLLDIVKNFIVFESEKDSKNNVSKTIKKLSAYHQYFAVNKAVEKTAEASSANGDRRAGVVWHTQGSGKSLSMVFYAGKIIQALDNPTLVLLTDRNDLDGQLFGVFSHCSDLIRQTPKQAQDRSDLKKLLSVASGGVVFTTIQKFMPEINVKILS
ncbi:MAG: Type I site-specific deoxyribonuclease, HsdR family [Candidatus Falkowbacteria bacterium GW2011_GWC2_38_22]|nr:MAG: Type I site-specific deoxyribonuclease, HsdR family [Candidatus Falkowbacteria bacterium GW2011_GWC2_38_22]